MVLAIAPLADIMAPIGIRHGALAVRFIPLPVAHITAAIDERQRSLAMVSIVSPFADVFGAIGKLDHAWPVSLTTAELPEENRASVFFHGNESLSPIGFICPMLDCIAVVCRDG